MHPSLDDMFTELRAELDRLNDRYIQQFLPAQPSQTPAVFEYDVKSYSILAHAAFEDFTEGVSKVLMNKVADDILAQRATVSTACFVMSYGQRVEIEESEEAEQGTCYTFVRLAVEEAKRRHSNVLMNNHGFSLKYLRKIFTPVGVNVPDGPERGSLRVLADARGSFAHSMAKQAMYGDYGKAQRVLTPEEARDAVQDCLGICERIKDQAKLLAA